MNKKYALFKIYIHVDGNQAILLICMASLVTLVKKARPFLKKAAIFTYFPTFLF